MMRLAASRVFVAAPGDGVLMHGHASYTQATGLRLKRWRAVETRDDLTDAQFVAFSEDNGRTWSEEVEEPSLESTTEGVHRWTFYSGWVDPGTGRFLEFANDTLLPNDEVLESMATCRIRCRVSADGGQTYLPERPVQRAGLVYSADHPFEGVHIGRNSMMLGDLGCLPLRRSDGAILLPVQVTPLGPDGSLINPGGGYTFHEALVLIGHWQADGSLAWEQSEYVPLSPDRSTRGAIEPTLAAMPGDRLMMVLRGSNDVKPELPGHKWLSVSEDGGLTWTRPEAWTYADGQPFHSPSSMSCLFRHSNGCTYWLGNICEGNPTGNSPRYPLVVGEVDPETLGLRRETVITIDDRQEQDPHISISNFHVREDRETAELVVQALRIHHAAWRADTHEYRLAPA